MKLKEKLMNFLKPELEKIKIKYKNIDDMKQDLDCALNCLVSCEIFSDKELNDNELSIFLDTYNYMLYYATIIDETMIELYNILDDDIEETENNYRSIKKI